MEQNTQETQEKKGFKQIAKSAAKVVLFPPVSLLGVGGVRDRHNRVVDALKKAYEIPKPIPVEKRKSFQWWVDHFGMTPADVEERKKQILLEARFLYAFGLIIFALGLSYAFDGSLMGLISGFAASWICFVAGWTRMFRYFQFQRKELCDLQVFVKSPEGWIA